MLRQLTALLLVWVGLATGTPALACSPAAADMDCCPKGAPIPCKDGASGQSRDATPTACCVAASVSAAAVPTLDSNRNLPVATADPGSPDPLILVAARVAALTDAARLPILTGLLVPRAHTDATPTYLSTGRLRL